MSSSSTNNTESYSGQSFSISQLLYVAKKKLQGTTLGRRIVTTLTQTEVDALEQDTLEVLNLVHSVIVLSSVILLYLQYTLICAQTLEGNTKRRVSLMEAPK
ncbi:hypothetical protein BDM02DRAFT_3192325 [Thelephora ganbajun]|uniref:Uncharacterized protein n=1 Tax=Thelephora ganbajun TaxID=370292 RepID=A0ACB6YZW1_THEGA|nr:hypothetical protein BDM02DRAFT_3192325 [Thelephora ganbajun]